MSARKQFTALCGGLFLLGTALSVGLVVTLIWTESVVIGKALMTSSFLAICGFVAGSIAMPEKDDRP